MIMPDIYKNMLIYNQHRNFSKIPFAIYADTKWLLEKFKHVITIQKHCLQQK